MSNGSDNFYHRLGRLLDYVSRHEGVLISVAYAKGTRLVKETKEWKIKDYFQRIYLDGHIVIQDKRFYTTEYKLSGGES